MDTWRRKEGEVQDYDEEEEGKIQDNDDDNEMIARFRVEHVFIAAPINISREKETDEEDMLIWTTTTGSRKE